LRLHDSSELRKQMGFDARRYVVAHFSRDTQAGEFAAVLNGILRKANAPARRQRHSHLDTPAESHD
jgi:hypothetical protein